MKTTLTRVCLALGVLLAGLPASVQAQDDLRADPGYLDLQDVADWFESEPWLEVNIKGALLDLVAEASRHEDEDLADLLFKLRAIQVRGYQLDEGRYSDVEQRTGELARRLEARGWETVARVRDRDERVDMYLMVEDGAIAGLVVMVLDPDSDDGAVFVNIVGDIRPEDVGRIGRKFDIDPLRDSAAYRRR